MERQYGKAPRYTVTYTSGKSATLLPQPGQPWEQDWEEFCFAFGNLLAEEKIGTPGNPANWQVMQWHVHTTCAIAEIVPMVANELPITVVLRYTKRGHPRLTIL